MARNVSSVTLSLLLLCLAIMLQGCSGGTMFPVTYWPLEPTGSTHPIGNSGSEFEDFSIPSAPYLHLGMDIMGNPAPKGPFVIVTSTGYVTLTTYGSNSTQNGIIISTSDSREYTYWHLDYNSIQQSVRDADAKAWGALSAGSKVARLHIWPSCQFHHLHYQIRKFLVSMTLLLVDPIWTVTPRNDTSDPVIEGVYFTEGGTNTELPTDSNGRPVLTGKVDIVAQAYDTQFGNYRTGVQSIWYVVIKPLLGKYSPVVQRGEVMDLEFPNNSLVNLIYRNSTPFVSNSDYCGTKKAYYVVTNVDDLGNITESGCWDTTAHPNGVYKVGVAAMDASGNTGQYWTTVVISN